MKKITLALYAVWFSAILNILPIHSMENHAQLAAQEEKYNADECLLFKLPNEMLFEVFLHRLSDDAISISSLYNDVKYFMPLNATCKHFNRLITLETIGHLYKKDLNKNEVLKEIIKQLDNSNKDKSLSILAQVLLHAGAYAKTRYNRTSALEVAIEQNEEKLVGALLKHGANPDIASMHGYENPLFFKAKTIPIAQILMDTGKINLCATDIFGNNILHHMTPACYSPELMEFYLQHQADATQLGTGFDNNFCILHEFALASFHYLSDAENMLEKIKILLKVVPHLVNTLTRNKQTPIDIVQDQFDIEIDGACFGNESEIAKKKALAFITLEKFITLFRDHGGLTAQELAERKPLDSHK